MIARICHCWGGPLEPSQKLICLTCIMGDPPEPQEPEEHVQSEWKAECDNDDVVLRKVLDL